VTVDVLLPFYGDVAMMKQAVESILGQTRKPDQVGVDPTALLPAANWTGSLNPGILLRYLQ